ncbi:MAG: hypothetical protein SGJ20_04380 [Planctomycetota bacterium]|nr:hypothetical protein [Planctomycetota bacterium]
MDDDSLDGGQSPDRERGGPSWAPFFTDQQWDQFIFEVKVYFANRSLPIEIEQGVVKVRTAEREVHQLGLSNLAQMCHAAERGEWSAIVSRHFEMLERSQEEVKAAEEDIFDFGLTRDKLHVRISDEDSIPEDLVVHRQDLPGTLSYLVLDLPSSVLNVKPIDAEMWGRSVDELFETAINNVQTNCKPQISEQVLQGGVKITALLGDSFFVASLALRLEKYSRCVGTYGSLVAIPHRHCLLAYRIESLEVVSVVSTLGIIARGMCEEGPGSISPRLYWYRDGQFMDLPYEIEDDSFMFRPPEAFVELLEELGKGDEGGAESPFE